MSDIGVITPALTGEALRVARIAVRFGRKPRSRGEFRPGVLGRLGRAANALLVRHRAWERRFVSAQLKEWRETRSLRPIRRLRRGLNIQMHESELNHILSVLEVKRPCAMLVFGMGNDSILWFEANRGGQTVFVEDDGYWDRVIRERHPSLRSVRVLYGTRAADWRGDIERAPALLLPAPVGNQAWDIILVDGPAGYKPEKPGRVQSVLAARRLVADNGAILVHDCDREAESAICGTVLSHMAMAGQVETLRHYIREPGTRSGRQTAPSQRDSAGPRSAGQWSIAAFDGASRE